MNADERSIFHSISFYLSLYHSISVHFADSVFRFGFPPFGLDHLRKEVRVFICTSVDCGILFVPPTLTKTNKIPFDLKQMEQLKTLTMVR